MLCLEKGLGIRKKKPKKQQKKLGLVEGGRWIRLTRMDTEGLLLHHETAQAGDSGDLKLFPLLLLGVLLGRNRCVWEPSGYLQNAVY